MKEDVNKEELTHHGILGMKWGVRRYQNKDGTLTPAGKKRADKIKEEYTALTGKRLIRKPTSKAGTSSDQNKETPVQKKRIKDMTDEEINDRINRLSNEKRLAGLQADTASPGQRFVRSVGKDVIAPAAIEAGRSLAKDLLIKIGKEKLGLNGKTGEAVDEVYGELKKEMDRSEFTVRKMKADKWIKDREAENKKAEERHKQAKEPEKAEAEFVKAKKVKNDSKDAFKSKEPTIIDIDIDDNRSTTSTALVPYVNNGKEYIDNLLKK